MPILCWGPFQNSTTLTKLSKDTDDDNDDDDVILLGDDDEGAEQSRSPAEQTTDEAHSAASGVSRMDNRDRVEEGLTAFCCFWWGRIFGYADFRRYACIYVNAYTCMYVYVCICLHACKYVYLHVS